MLGFTAPYAGGEATVRDAELQDVRWFGRAEIEAAAREDDDDAWGTPGDPGGPLRLPPRLAIARRLVENWLGGGQRARVDLIFGQRVAGGLDFHGGSPSLRRRCTRGVAGVVLPAARR